MYESEALIEGTLKRPENFSGESLFEFLSVRISDDDEKVCASVATSAKREVDVSVFCPPYQPTPETQGRCEVV